MTLLIALLCLLALAFANGANDNFKGVATLFGSGVTDYRRALNWGSAATLAGSIAAIALAAHLVAAFSGKLFVSASVLSLQQYPLAVCAAAAATVLLATHLGLPISTTHALAGGLLGAAVAAMPGSVNWAQAGQSILLPLAVSPLLSFGCAMGVYPLFGRARRRLGVGRETCVCVGETLVPVPGGAVAMGATVTIGEAQECREQYTGTVAGIEAGRAVDALHYVSAGAVSFARGVNDTPKIVALMMLTAPVVQGAPAFVAVGLVILAGGLLGARRVAETMAHKVTAMNPGQGFTANLVTSALVIAASPLGLPVSTTHVSCGALFGIGAVTGQAHWKMIAAIAGAWLVTLPLAALLGAMFMRAALA